jgi:hypothetical protein
MGPRARQNVIKNSSGLLGFSGFYQLPNATKATQNFENWTCFHPQEKWWGYTSVVSDRAVLNVCEWKQV